MNWWVDFGWTSALVGINRTCNAHCSTLVWACAGANETYTFLSHGALKIFLTVLCFLLERHTNFWIVCEVLKSSIVCTAHLRVWPLCNADYFLSPGWQSCRILLLNRVESERYLSVTRQANKKIFFCHVHLQGEVDCATLWRHGVTIFSMEKSNLPLRARHTSSSLFLPTSCSRSGNTVLL